MDGVHNRIIVDPRKRVLKDRWIGHYIWMQLNFPTQYGNWNCFDSKLFVLHHQVELPHAVRELKFCGKEWLSIEIQVELPHAVRELKSMPYYTTLPSQHVELPHAVRELKWTGVAWYVGYRKGWTSPRSTGIEMPVAGCCFAYKSCWTSPRSTGIEITFLRSSCKPLPSWTSPRMNIVWVNVESIRITGFYKGE